MAAPFAHVADVITSDPGSSVSVNVTVSPSLFKPKPFSAPDASTSASPRNMSSHHGPLLLSLNGVPPPNSATDSPGPRMYVPNVSRGPSTPANAALSQIESPARSSASAVTFVISMNSSSL